MKNIKLKFIKPHASIDQFNEAEIPNFCVLTGLNGSGKSHFLEAIENKSISIIGIEQPRIAYFNYQSFQLENGAKYSGEQLSTERENAWAYFNQHFKNNIATWKTHLGDDYLKATTAAKKDKRSLWSINEPTVKKYKESIRNMFDAYAHRAGVHTHRILSLAQSLEYSIDEITHEAFLDSYKPIVLKKSFYLPAW